MPYPLNKGLSGLRKNRIAVPGARYFITAVTRDRKCDLDGLPVWAKLLELVCRTEADVWAAVLMPDHLHFFFVLPVESKPGDVVRAIKGPLVPLLRDMDLAWQKNYFEHRLREHEDSEPYLRYMMSNPYRANLVSLEESWPYWAVTSHQAQWFIDKFPLQRPEPEWLEMDQPWEDFMS